jgi:hypothetical protein
LRLRRARRGGGGVGAGGGHVGVGGGGGTLLVDAADEVESVKREEPAAVQNCGQELRNGANGHGLAELLLEAADAEFEELVEVEDVGLHAAGGDAACGGAGGE